MFSLGELAAKYKKLSQDVNLEAELAKKEKVKSTVISKKLQSFLERFESLLVDPYLPEELFPDYKEREKAQKSIASLGKIVAKSI